MLVLRQHRGWSHLARAPGWYSKSIWISVRCKILNVGLPGYKKIRFFRFICERWKNIYGLIITLGGTGGTTGGLGTFGKVMFQLSSGDSTGPQSRTSLQISSTVTVDWNAILSTTPFKY